MEWMLMPLRRYADFSGRSRRKEYWLFALLQFLIYLAVVVVTVLFAIVASARGSGSDEVAGVMVIIGMILFGIVGLALFIPSLAVTVRRLHDQDFTGWLILIQFVPFGPLVLLVMMCLEGTRGPNRFGEDPTLRSAHDIFS